MAYHERKELDYDSYIYMQGRKARDPKEYKKILNNIDKRKRNFETVFTNAKHKLNEGSLLCLGARTGEEVDVAKQCGFYPCIGIDLYPLGGDVIKADWHDMPFDDDFFDNAYTNSIDHCYDVEILAMEIKRVLVPEGKFYFQVEKKKSVGDIPDPRQFIQNHKNDFLFWDKGIDIANVFVDLGFTLTHTWDNKRWENFILAAK